ncbi:MAG TPA: thiol:disulfide interchange protein DsbA/DsbL [Rubrivivax sp.]|jgi:thiol:disulfide interchange protein DsbA|nr:thiol:disulfide interchange protein DsbA/DsbL [Pseudomonadota bacterium]HPP83327.1 thiol:disulfide interchange protein DsbA/DsbL [Rubrivivax sp.]
MNRRDFHGNLAGAALALMTPGHARAQAAPVEGQSYVRLQNAAPLLLPTPDKKVDVIEFFWYGCPHCNAFEPMLSNWADRLAADVSFRRVHVGFGPVHQVHQKLYYALEETGLVQTLHRKVFAAIHRQGRRLVTEAAMRRFLEDNGVDAAQVMDAFGSFAVATKAARAKQLTDAYKIDGVPAMGVQGRYYTSGSLTGSHERMLQVTDYLIQRARLG